MLASVEQFTHYIDNQFLEYFRQERCLTDASVDNRVHALVYFITPTGSRLYHPCGNNSSWYRMKPWDILALKELAKKVNVIPVIAKSDTLTSDELLSFKHNVLLTFRDHKIPIYPFGIPNRKRKYRLETLIPFSVIGSTELKEDEQGRLCRYREYPWGILDGISLTCLD